MKMIKRFTAGVIAVAMALSLIPAFALTASAVDFDGGDGTEGNPYLISTAEQLDAVRNNLSGNYKLTRDIDLSEICGEEIGKSWTGIGNSSNQFKGTFDGDGHTITGLYINSSSSNQGLFGYVGSSGTVKNLGVSGSVTSKSNNVGGIVGWNKGTVTNCYNTGKITGQYAVGGVAGQNDNEITNSYNTGNVEATGSSGNGSYAGGIAGGSNGSIINSYNTGAVKGSSGKIGGITGEHAYGKIENCYNTGAVSGNGSVGGIVGNIYFGGSQGVTNCYYLEGTADKGIGSGSDSTEKIDNTGLKSLASTLGSEWTDSARLGRPVLKSNSEAADNEFEIPDLATLEKLRNYINNGNTGEGEYFKLTADIDLGGQEWIPIGNDSSHQFNGTFDGGGHTISGLSTNKNIDYQGLFGFVGSTGTVENLSVSGDVSGKDYVGGIAGSNSGTITNCNHTGSVEGSGFEMIIDQYGNTRHIIGGNYIGGVAGYNTGTVTNCYNTGDVTGESYYDDLSWYWLGGKNIGGVVGSNYGTVESCYNTGTVNGGENVGGVAGENSRFNSYDPGNSLLTNCYNTGGVNGREYVGGVVGSNYGNSTVTNCYSYNYTNGTRLFGYVAGYNSGTVANCYYSFNMGAPGFGSGNGEATYKNTTDFASGEVTWLLQDGQDKQVWGQTITGTSTDTFPVLSGENSKKVLKVTFKANDNEDILRYTNSGKTVTDIPSVPRIYKWMWKDDEFTSSTIVKEDIIVTKNDNIPFDEGDGTAEKPYEIPDLETLEAFCMYINSGKGDHEYFKLTANIDMSEACSKESGKSWTPIGNDTNQFKGTFDGGGHKITGLYINAPSSNNQGLFGYVGEGGTVKNLGVSGNVEGRDYVGSVVGYNQGTVENCYNTGDIKGGNNVGGVVGENSGTVQNCYNTGNVKGSQSVGGVAGGNSGTVKNCYFLTGAADSGIGSGSGTNVEVKTANQFASGEVAWLLQDGQDTQVWGQTITGTSTDKFPVLTGEDSKKVLKVTFKRNDNKDILKYTNPGNMVTDIPSIPEIYKWMCNGSEFTSSTEVTADIIVTMVLKLDKGEGTAESPYEIPDLETLEAFRVYINSGKGAGEYFKLTADIDMSDKYNSSTGTSWTPIGNNTNQFKGTFDGGGHKITGLYINAPSSNYQGLFGYVDRGGTVKNLGVSGSVTSEINSVGGVVGYNYGTIENCYNTGDIKGGNSVGGVAGYNYGTVQNCYNTGDIKGGTWVGGVAGYNYGTVQNCYNTGDIKDGTYVGGVAGYNDRSGTVQNCYNTGAVTGSSSSYYIGGVAGYNYLWVNVTNCYYLTGTAKTGIGGYSDSITNVEDKTADQFASGEVAWLLQNPEKVDSYYAAQITQVWGQTITGEDTDEFPVLTGENSKKVLKVTFIIGNNTNYAVRYTNLNNTVTDIPSVPGKYKWMWDGSEFTSSTIVTADINVTGETLLFDEGDGTEQNPYEISDLKTLEGFRDYINDGNGDGKYFKLTADIDMSKACSEESGTSWTPIGNDTNRFKGTFDGNGYKITGLYINSTSDYQGLFGYVGEGGTVKNLGVSGNVEGSESVGGVVGYSSGTVTNCYNTGAVTGSSSSYYIGGVVGYSSGTVTNCYNTGNITGTSAVGGIVGYNYYGTVTNCYNIGDVTGSSYVGSIAGDGYGYGNYTNNYYLTGTAAGGLNGRDDDGITAIGASGFAEESTFVDWDFENTWEMGTADGKNVRPILTNNKETDIEHLPTPFEKGNGTAGNPYEISDLETLERFRDYINKGSGKGEYFKLTNNIDMNSNESWTPIGLTYDNSFEGTFDGNNHEITGLYINAEGAEDAGNQGLFGYIGNGGTVKNLGVSGNVSGSGMMAAVGGIAGSSEGTITNCYNTGAVSGSGMMAAVGGIAGANGGTIKNCYNTGEVSGSGVMVYVGGIAGMDQSMMGIKNCYNTGAVSGTVIYISEELVEAMGFSGMAGVGGITGAGFGMAANCYNVGKIESSVTAEGADDNVIAVSGGIIGLVSALDEEVTLPENCYYLESSAEKGVGSVIYVEYDSDTDERTIDSDVKDEEGKTEAKTAAEFAQKDTFTNWEFNSTWKMGATAEGTNVRPILQAIAETDLEPLPAVEKFMVEIYEDSIITENGTGQHKDEVASGFVATITSNLNRAAISGLSVNVGDKTYTPNGNLPELTIDSGSGIVIGIIIPGITITSASAITFNIE